jgi:hypothetical protein
MLAIIANEEGQATLADDAESLVEVEVRSMGQSVLQKWAEQEVGRQDVAMKHSGINVKKKPAKKSIGTASTEKSE